MVLVFMSSWAVHLPAEDRPPVVHLPFDSGFQDAGPHGFVVTNRGNEVAISSGIVDHGVHIGGTEDWVDVALDSRVCLTNGATLSFWFCRDAWENPYRAGSGWQTLAHVDGLTVNITAPGCPSHKPWLLELSVGWTHDRTGGDVKPIRLLYENRTITPNIWRHVAVVHDPSTPKTVLYLDGVMVAASPEAPRLAGVFVNPLRLGTWHKANQAFRGFLDEVTLYDYTRTPEQIRAAAQRR